MYAFDWKTNDRFRDYKKFYFDLVNVLNCSIKMYYMSQIVFTIISVKRTVDLQYDEHSLFCNQHFVKQV